MPYVVRPPSLQKKTSNQMGQSSIHKDPRLAIVVTSFQFNGTH